MRKKARLLSLFLVFVLCFYGCSSAVKTTAQTPVASAEPTAVPTPQILRSKTSGKILSAPVVYKPIGVMIENDAEARPQTGTQAADVVYEAVAEGGINRLFCIFNDTLPTSVGPVRSARVYYMRIQQEWDCAYVHFGGAEYGPVDTRAPENNGHIKLNINFLDGKYDSYYTRITTRSAPRNAYTDVQKLQTLMTYEAQGRTFLFNEIVAYSGDPVTEVTVPLGGDKVTYKYDSKNDVFVRYMGGKEFKDAATNKAVTVKNLIVQTAHYHNDGMPKGLLFCDLVGSGNADFFINGKHISGTWSRTSYDAPTVYKDANGKEIVLQPGNTWLEIQPDTAKITVK